MNGLTEQQLAFLQQYGFDVALQQRWQKDVAAGRLAKATNAVTGELHAPPPNTLKKLPGSTTKAARELERLGRDAIDKGQVGMVVLNGGMATRFGGVVKGVVPVLGKDRSFLALAVEDCRKHATREGGTVPLFLMNSFATDTATKAHRGTLFVDSANGHATVSGYLRSHRLEKVLVLTSLLFKLRKMVSVS